MTIIMISDEEWFFENIEEPVIINKEEIEELVIVKKDNIMYFTTEDDYIIVSTEKNIIKKWYSRVKIWLQSSKYIGILFGMILSIILIGIGLGGYGMSIYMMNNDNRIGKEKNQINKLWNIIYSMNNMRNKFVY